MEYKKYEMNNYNIHTIKTDKFKTVGMEIMFTKKTSKDDMHIYTFLSDIMTDTSKDYSSRKSMAIRMEELYKMNFFGTTYKNGNLFYLSFNESFINPKYIKEQDYLENVTKFIFDVINNPNVKNNEFDITNFNIVKTRMLKSIDSVYENSTRLAIKESLECMDKDSITSTSVMGSKEQVEMITPGILYKYYKKIFTDFNLDIFIIGDVDFEKMIKIIDEKVNIKNDNNKRIKMNVNNKLTDKVNKKSNNTVFSESTLTMIYNVDKLSKEEKNIDFSVFNYIFGNGGITSKLYTSLRNENSLCYGVRSIYLKYDNLLIVNVSLDDKNVSLAEKLIKNDLKAMTKGEFTEAELEEAKKSLCFGLKVSMDGEFGVLNNYIFNVIDDLPLVDERIEETSKITKEDVIKCAKSLKLNTVYIGKAKK